MMAKTQQQILPPAKPPRPTAIQGLTPRLPERGKIKLGQLGEERTAQSGRKYRLPVKNDHFTITTLERGQDGNFAPDAEIHKMLGTPHPTDIPVRLLYDDQSLNMPTRYACYNGQTLWCSGDGVEAMRLADGKEYTPCQCPCPRKEPTYQGEDKCKMNGALSVLIDGAGGLGGVWTFRTTSYNSIVGILSSMSFLKTVTAGILANIPLRLTVRPKLVSLPTDPGKTSTVYIAGIEFRGTMADLQQAAQQLALERATNHVRIENIEHEARRLIGAASMAVPLPGDDNAAIVAEFYPEQVVEAPAPVADGTPRPQRQAPAPLAHDGQPYKGQRVADMPDDASASAGDVMAAAGVPIDTDIELVTYDGEVQTFKRTSAGIEAYILAMEKAFHEAVEKVAWWESDASPMWTELMHGAVVAAGKPDAKERVKRIAAEFDRVQQIVNAALVERTS